MCLGSIKDIVAGEEEEGGPILPTFPNLELLEVDGSYQYKNNDTTPLLSRRYTWTTGGSSGQTTSATTLQDGEQIRSEVRTCLAQESFRSKVTIR